MTGKELIQMIINEHLEDYEVVVSQSTGEFFFVKSNEDADTMSFQHVKGGKD